MIKVWCGSRRRKQKRINEVTGSLGTSTNWNDNRGKYLDIWFVHFQEDGFVLFIYRSKALVQMSLGLK